MCGDYESSKASQTNAPILRKGYSDWKNGNDGVTLGFQDATTGTVDVITDAKGTHRIVREYIVRYEATVHQV